MSEFQSSTTAAIIPNLTDRELEIIELVAAGLKNEEIADRLDIKKRTVDNHISNVLKVAKAHDPRVDNRVALVRWALNWGKVCIDEINCCRLPLPPGSTSTGS
jgi:DNA-binding NarL/FixJ family response regulator